MSSSVEGSKEWSKKMVVALWELYLKGISVDLKLEAINGDLIQIHSCIFHCCCSHQDARLLAIKLPYSKDIIEKLIEFLYTGSILELIDDDVKAVHDLSRVLNFNELTKLLALRLEQLKAKPAYEEPPLPENPSPQYTPEPRIKPLTSTEVYLKYKDSNSDAHKMDFTKSTLTARQAKRVASLYRKNPKLFAKPVKIKLSGDNIGIEKIVNVSVKESKVAGKSSLQIIQTPSSLKIKDTHKALRLQNLASKSDCYIPPEGPWTCTLCTSGPQKSFESYYACRQHLKTVHSKRFDSRSCEHCGFKSYRRTILFHHAFLTHGVPPPKNVVFPKCGDCNYVAANSWDLQKHSKTHGAQRSSSAPSEHPSLKPEPLHLLNLAVPMGGDLGGLSEQTMYILTEDPSAPQFASPLILASEIQGIVPGHSDAAFAYTSVSGEQHIMPIYQ